MLDFPVVTEDDLQQMSMNEVINVVMRLQQLCLLSDDQIAMYKKLTELQQQTIEILKGEM